MNRVLKKRRVLAEVAAAVVEIAEDIAAVKNANLAGRLPPHHSF
jgi:hypothetical protein